MTRRQTLHAFTRAIMLALIAAALAVTTVSALWDPDHKLWLPFLGRNAVLGFKGVTVSGLNVQNLDALAPAQVLADYYKQGGGASIPINRPPIPPLTVSMHYLPMEPVGNGDGIYASVVHSDRRVAAIARTEWPRGGGAALYDSVIPSTNVVVPLYVKGVAGQQTHVAIQNSDESNPARATVRLYRSGQSTPAFEKTIDIGAGTSVMFEGTEMPSPFVGSLAVESTTPVGAVAFVDFENSEKAVYAFEGVPVEQAADTLYAPLIRNGFYGTTGISVVNPGTTQVSVTLDIVGSLFSSGQSNCIAKFTDGPQTIAPGSSFVFYQGGSGTRLPVGCAGAAKITATGGKVLAIVNDASGNPAQPTTSAAYTAISRAQAAKRVALPLYRNQHTGAQLTTGIQAMNVDDIAARVTIRFMIDGVIVSDAACGLACSQTIAPGGSYTWYPPMITAVPRGKVGSAFIESDQLLAVIVNDASLTGQMDAAIYNGIKADDP